MNQKIILFASGNGSNAENIFRFFEKNNNVDVLTVYTNNSKARVINRFKPLGINVEVFNRKSFISGSLLKNVINQNPDLIILAGFLWKFGSDWIEAFNKKIVNIHPSLLPKYGGIGMYGDNVYKAVKENCESETGITIHYINEFYDEGAIIFQEKVKLDKDDNLEDISYKTQKLEHKYFPKVIKDLLSGSIK
ncbi:MAG: phosphoribosylglycinamide formyltransferase [Flavobacteriaceae bacterium]|nr:phosphoribosylglycinamide formyltransferase [Flavobacteriaceae bacterium]MAM01628.1 phosphoribosylglycinamide formyltransferase [Flavobacteriaceae bacterium]|tara:strand:+ start:22294 stop:22869 length:576 start_codon:yes stop_codon:yes gene_type:complete